MVAGLRLQEAVCGGSEDGRQVCEGSRKRRVGQIARGERVRWRRRAR